MADNQTTQTASDGESSVNGVIDDALFEDKLDSIYLAEARVYIAGVLMPVVRVTITTTFNQMPQAEISLPAYSELLYLGEYDRVPVQIFARETMVECPEFILMFEGFIASTTYVNSALQRTVAVHCVSYFDVLNDIHIKAMSQLHEFFEPAVNGAEDVTMHTVAPTITYPYYFLQYKLVQPDAEDLKEGDTIKFPSDFLESIYAYVQLAHPPKGSNGWDEDPKLGVLQASALTIYYGELFRTINFLGRFERLPWFDKEGFNGKLAWETDSVSFEKDRATIFPMLYGIQTAYAMNSLAKGITEYRETGAKTLMDLLMFLIDEMEYEYLVITNPAYHAPESGEDEEEKAADKSGGAESSASAKPSGQDEPKKPGIDEPADKRGRLVCSCLKPLLMDSMPPGCNIMYRSMVDNVTVHLQHKGTPTRVRIFNAHSPLALLGASGAQDPLKKFGLVDYYPSRQYPGFDPGSVEPKISYWKSELLEIEQFCGPWVREVGTPRWLHYMYSNVAKEGEDPLMVANGQEAEPMLVFKERFMRRQLLMAKYAPRQVQISGMFDPYITPGFPGVVFDNQGAGFAFAGHVMTVAHTITPTDVSTQVIMDFGRPLSEAVEIEIPNALSFMHDITHKAEPLTEIYQTILGTPFTSDESDKNRSKEETAKLQRAFNLRMPGACAITFSDLNDKSLGTESSTDPNNNPREAYTAKRRNVCTFDRYLKFMQLKAGLNDGPEGPNTPVMLYGDFLEKRRPLDVYQTEIIFDPVMPEKEQTTPGKKETQTGSQQTASQKAEAKGKEEEEKKAKLVKVKKQMDVRDLLYLIAKREFSKFVYR